MPKAAAADVIELGFNETQFNAPTNWAQESAGGYVYDILADQALEVEGAVGSVTYAAASATGTDTEKLNFSRIRRAEMYLTAAQLWRRIEAFERGNKAIDHTAISSRENPQSRPLANADAAEQEAWYLVGLITGEPRDGALSTKYVQSGRLSTVTP